jgi:dTDP-4-amino-4,6-dideoxygalactose transaminase
VALPNLTFWATYEAIAQLGATPVLIDVDPDDLQLDLAELARAFESHRFAAAILVHLMGWASPRLAEIRQFCSDRGIELLEDGAQSYGVEVDGRSVYAGARVSTLSFYPAKVIGGCMDGGAVLTDDEALAGLVRRLCNHGRSTHFSYSHVGWSSRSGALQASWLLAMLRHADRLLADRRAWEARYRTALEPLRALARPHAPAPGVTGNGYLSVFALERHAHERIAGRLGAERISVGRVYPDPLSEQAPAQEALRVSELSASRAFCRRVINLPLFFGMTGEEHAHVCRAFARALREEA